MIIFPPSIFRGMSGAHRVSATRGGLSKPTPHPERIVSADVLANCLIMTVTVLIWLLAFILITIITPASAKPLTEAEITQQVDARIAHQEAKMLEGVTAFKEGFFPEHNPYTDYFVGSKSYRRLKVNSDRLDWLEGYTKAKFESDGKYKDLDPKEEYQKGVYAADTHEYKKGSSWDYHRGWIAKQRERVIKSELADQ